MSTRFDEFLSTGQSRPVQYGFLKHPCLPFSSLLSRCHIKRTNSIQKQTSQITWIYQTSFFFSRFYLFFRERGREGEREGEKHQCMVAFQAPPTGDLACNPGMSWLGIKPVTLWFAGPCSIHWATPARADSTTFLILVCFPFDFSRQQSLPLPQFCVSL